MKYFLIIVLFSISNGINAQNLYLKFNLADSSATKLHSIIYDYHINRNGYWEEQYLYNFYGTFTTPHIVGTVEWWEFDEHFITVNKNNFQLIDESEVNNYNPLNVEQLGAVLQAKTPYHTSVYFENFQKIFVIEVGLPNNKAKVIEVHRMIGPIEIIKRN